MLAAVLPRLEGPTLILDAEPLACVADHQPALRTLAGKLILTPHPGEAAAMLEMEEAAVADDPLAAAREAAERFGAVVALKGSATAIVTPAGKAWINRSGNVGLATSGSGDTLSGVIAGLAARGAAPDQATAWGVFLHGRAGDLVARRAGQLGFLARELLGEVPALMAALAAPTARGSG